MGAYNSCYLCTMGNYSTSPLIYIPSLDFRRFRSIYLRDTLGLDLVELIQIRLKSEISKNIIATRRLSLDDAPNTGLEPAVAFAITSFQD